MNRDSTAWRVKQVREFGPTLEWDSLPVVGEGRRARRGWPGWLWGSLAGFWLGLALVLVLGATL